MTRRLVSIAAACGVLALPAGASAHTGVKSNSPRAGGTVSRDLSVVKVKFEGRVSDATLIVARRGVEGQPRRRHAREPQPAGARPPARGRAGRYSATVRG